MRRMLIMLLAVVVLATACPGSDDPETGSDFGDPPSDIDTDDDGQIDGGTDGPTNDDGSDGGADPGENPSDDTDDTGEPDTSEPCVATTCPFAAAIGTGDTCTEVIEVGRVGNGGPCGFETPDIEVWADADTVYIANEPPPGGSVFGGIQFDSMEGSHFLDFVSDGSTVEVVSDRRGPGIDEQGTHPGEIIDAGGRSWIAIRVREVVPEEGFVNVSAGRSDSAGGMTVGARAVRVSLDTDNREALQDTIGLAEF